MLILVMLGVVLFSGIIGAVICVCIDKFSSRWAPDWLSAVSAGAIICSVVIGFIVGGAAMTVQVNKELDYQKALDQRAALIRGMEYVENADVSAAVSVDIFSDVANFNAELRKCKRWANSPWLNVFYNDLIAENVAYIPLSTHS